MSAPHVSGTVALMLSYLVSTKYNIDSTVGLNKAIKTAIQRSATPLKAAQDAAKVPGGFLTAPGAISSLRTGGFLPPSASSFPIYVIVALIGVVVGMVLTCVIGLFVRTLWKRRREREERVEERRRLLQQDARSHQAAPSPQRAPPPPKGGGLPSAKPPVPSRTELPQVPHGERGGSSVQAVPLPPVAREGTIPSSTPFSMSRICNPRPHERGAPTLPSTPEPRSSRLHEDDLRTTPLSHRLSDSNLSEGSSVFRDE